MGYITIKDLNFSYNRKQNVLNNINVEINKGDWVAVLGHNGSGKSTLAKALVGLIEPQSGTITIDGLELTEESAYDIRKKIGIVFQNPDNQFVGVTVRDDIAFGMENLQVAREEMIERILFYADKVQMKNFLDKEPSQLSGGQKQRVAIAGILAMKTDIIIFDEATSMLDPSAREELMSYIKSLHDEGLTIIMITHDINEALLADKLLILKEGEVFAQDDSRKLMRHKHLFVESHLELPVALDVANELKDKKYDLIKETLWAYVSMK
ncbi:MAG: energy-coupling factor transporter ATPase [Tenericutes bacterium]|jgi:energy-coupling factor transport system ATP-binding protein|nr:energy-coupling factor transporter ATPase [Mycoplasmatota bacterium]